MIDWLSFLPFCFPYLIFAADEARNAYCVILSVWFCIAMKVCGVLVSTLLLFLIMCYTPYAPEGGFRTMHLESFLLCHATADILSKHTLLAIQKSDLP